MGRTPTIPPAEWPGITARYTAGEDAAALGTPYGVSREAIYRIVRRSGGVVGPRGGSPPLAETVQDEICRLYQDKIGASTLAKQFGVDKRSVYNVLIRRGIGTRPRANRTGDDYHVPGYQARQLARPRPGHARGPRGAFNLDAFAELDEAAAYWVGYLITDGCIGEYDGRSPRLFLPQARKHREQCEKLTAYLGSELEVRDDWRETFGHLRAFSRCSFTLPRQVADRLLALGVRPVKTGTASAPEILRGNAAFWRGVVDGDGSVFATKLRANSASPRLANQFRRFAYQVTGARSRAYRNQAGVWMVEIGRQRNAAKIARILYEGARVYLTPKYQRALLLMLRE